MPPRASTRTSSASWRSSQGLKAPPVLVLNKIDRVKKERLLELASSLNARAAFAATFMISALNGDGVADLKAHLAAVGAAGALALSRRTRSRMRRCA